MSRTYSHENTLLFKCKTTKFIYIYILYIFKNAIKNDLHVALSLPTFRFRTESQNIPSNLLLTIQK